MRPARAAAFGSVVILVGVLAFHRGVTPSGPATSQVAHTAASFGAGWPTYHRDNARDGYDASAPAITKFNPVSHWSTPVTGVVYAEPLVWNGMVIAATEQDHITALDESTGAVLWDVTAGTAVNTHYCGSEINPIGITSTPVIDTSTNIVYAVGLVTGPKWQLFARHLADGSNVSNFPVDITPTVATSTGNVTMDPTVEEQRGALGLANGHVYVPFGGWLGDCGNYHPWVVSIPTSGVGGVDHNYFPQNSNQREAGIWAAQGMAIDGSGNLYVATGNGGTGSSTSCTGLTYDHGNGVFKLSSTLAEMNAFVPSNWCQLSASDTDVGSIAPNLIAGGDVWQMGKNADGYLLSSTLSLLDPSTAIGTCASGDAIFGGASYAAPDLYFACNSSGALEALTINTGTNTFSTHWTAGGFTPGPPIVEGGLIWTLNIGANPSHLYGYDTAGSRVVDQTLKQGVRHFTTPAADGDWIFTPDVGMIEGFSFAPNGGPQCAGNPCRIYTADAYGGVNADEYSPAITNRPSFSSPVARAAHFAPSGTAGVTPPLSGLVLDAFGGLHPYGSPALMPSQYPYFPNFDIARDFVWLPNGTGGYVLDGFGGIHPFSIGSNPLPPQPSQYPYFPGRDVAKKITLLGDASGGWVLDAYGGLHPWSVTGHNLPTAMAEYGYWPNQNIARDIWLDPASTAASASGIVLDGFGGLHPFWSASASMPAAPGQYPYWYGNDIGRSLWFLPSATPGAWTGYELDGAGGIHPFCSAGQNLPPALAQYPYWAGQDIAKTLFGA